MGILLGRGEKLTSPTGSRPELRLIPLRSKPMLIPYNTDAPIYHWPFATVGMIFVNFVVFVLCTQHHAALVKKYEQQQEEMSPEELLESEFGLTSYYDPWAETLDPYILHYGTIRPWEWVTSNFIHGDFLHLLGNMAVLWGLGLIVEGKVGWWRFMLIYFGIGITQCAMEQTLTYFIFDGGSFGASAIVFGLVAMALIWAPRNDLSCIVFFGYVWAMDIGVMVYSAIVLTIEVVLMILSTAGGSFGITSAVLHLMGAVVGAAVALAMLKLNWVDCEGFDLLAVMTGREGKQRRPSRHEEEEKLTPEQLAQQREMSLNQIRHLIAEGQPQLAHAANQRMRREHPDWHLPAGDFLKLIAAFHKQKLWVDSLPLMISYLVRSSFMCSGTRSA